MSTDVASLGVKERLRFLAKDSVVYGIAATINRATALLTFPLLARHFSVSEFGIVDSLILLVSVLSTMVIFGQDSAVARYFFEVESLVERREIVSQSIVFQCLVLMVAVPILYCFQTPLGTLFSSRTPSTNIYMPLIILQIPLVILQNFSQGILKWTFARMRFIIVSVGSTLLLCLGTVALVVSGYGTVNNILAMHFLTRVIFSLTSLWFIRKWLAFPTNFQYLPAMLSFAWPYGLICILTVFIPATERSMIVNLIGETEQGIFAASAKLGAFIALPVYAFQVAWGPFSLAIYKAENSAVTYNWVLKFFAITMFALTLLVTALGYPLITFLATDRYIDGVHCVFAICMSMSIQAIGWITEIGIDLSKKSYLKLYSNVFAYIVTFVAIYLLASRFGLVGVPWGTLLGVLTKTAIESSLAQKVYPLNWQYKGVLRLGTLVIAMGLCSQLVLSRFGANANLAVCIAFVASTLGLGWFTVFNIDERTKVVCQIDSLLRHTLSHKPTA